MSGPNVASPISSSEFEQFVLSRPYFEAAGLILAIDADERIAGFVHCGFGPLDPHGHCWELERALGTLAVLVAGHEPELHETLIEAGIAYLRSRDAKVIYAGGRFPLNPFYWGLYGGSELSGVLRSQPHVHQALTSCGFRTVAESVLFEYDLSKPEPRHLNNALLRRESRFHVLEDEPGECSWTSLALEVFHPFGLKITNRLETICIARATLWPMSLFGRNEGPSRIGLIDFHVEEEYRRKGYGRLLLTESVKCVAELGYHILCVQTDAANEPATTLYDRSGFKRGESAAFYRLDAHGVS
jgi:ribosomal protein S18 acetylase RimI-like enzyme